jgi:hypothetical protein
VLGKDGRRVNMMQKMCKKKMIPVETVPGIGTERMKENG